MSRDYRVRITVEVNNDDLHAVEDRLDEDWNLKLVDVAPSVATWEGEVTLGGGRTFEYFAHLVQCAVWLAIKRYARVDTWGVLLEFGDHVAGDQATFADALEDGKLDDYCVNCGKLVPLGINCPCSGPEPEDV